MRCRREAGRAERSSRPVDDVGGHRRPPGPLLVFTPAVAAASTVLAVLLALSHPVVAVALPLAPMEGSGASGVVPGEVSAGVSSGVSAGLPRPAGWPLSGPADVVRGFDPPAQRWGAGHRGVDLAGHPGQPVLSAAAGTVSFAGRVAGVGVVVVDHGGLRTTYQPVLAGVPVGRRVALGQQIGVLTADQRGEDCPRTDAEPGDDGAPPVCLHWGLIRGSVYLDPLSLIAGDEGAVAERFRLLPASEVAAVRARAAAVAAAAAAQAAAMSQGWPAVAGALRPLGPPGRHGFARPVPGAITSPFGRRFHPILHIWKLHDGTDFGAACGTPIRAPYPGRVTQQYANVGYGNRLMIDHGTVDGHRVTTGYNHALRYVVPVGATVNRGQLIGFVGETGYATGCHLHLMVWVDGQLVDPMTWF